MSKNINITDLENLYSQVVKSMNNRKSSSGSISAWLCIYTGKITTRDQLMKYLNCSLASANRYIRNLRETGFIRTENKDDKITWVAGRSKLRHCNVFIEDEKDLSNLDIYNTNKQTNSLNDSNDIDNINIDNDLNTNNIFITNLDKLSLEDQQRSTKIAKIASKIAKLFSQSTSVSEASIENIIEFKLADVSTENINENVFWNIAVICKKQYDNPELRPIRKDGQYDKIRNIIAFFSYKLNKHFASKVVYIDQYKTNISNQGDDMSSTKENRLQAKYEGIKSELINNIYIQNRPLFTELFIKAEDKLSLYKCMALAENLKSALNTKRFDYDDRRYFVHNDCFEKAIKRSVSNWGISWGYIINTYFDVCFKSGRIYADLDHESWDFWMNLNKENIKKVVNV